MKMAIRTLLFGLAIAQGGLALVAADASPRNGTPSAPLAGAAGRGSVLAIYKPLERAVFQRDARNLGNVPAECSVPEGADRVEVRAINRQTSMIVLDWTGLPCAGTVRTGSKSLPLPAGWYRLEFRAQAGGKTIQTGTVARVGVGEVFLTAGQSNSANHGGPPQKPVDERVSACDWQTGQWRHADDPQPGASGINGSPWPLLGDLLAGKFDVPVGFLSAGMGGTEVAWWLPALPNYSRLKTALAQVAPHGLRAVLWHQGESDSLLGTSAESYAQMLTSIITQSRQDAGFEVPWGVALVSWHPYPKATPENQAKVIAGQKLVIARVPRVFAGPATDSYHLRNFLVDGIHFNAQGLAAHAQGWCDALAPIIQPCPSPSAK